MNPAYFHVQHNNEDIPVMTHFLELSIFGTVVDTL